MTTTQQPTEALVAELVGTERVHGLPFDYAFHLDMSHPDELAALFTEDCYVAYGQGFGAEGHAAYRETMGGTGSSSAATSHHVGHRRRPRSGHDYGWRFARREPRADGVVDVHVNKQIPIGRAES
ncbi:nuclear transport factor 2 family protein [Saccharopolyspora pogona]|uniref:nuclear transport factor 2 family protein n=1 Tax=Saccharopolyspora pogona TaxID=333966 RepID=UPI001683D33D|nr:nuclear transport factor 2 family protein [Saccharopolyspora pogona]